MFIKLPVEQQLAEIAAAGFRYAEVSCESIVDPAAHALSAEHARRVRRWAEQAGVQTPQVHYPIVTLNPAVHHAGFHPDALTDLAHPVEARREFELRCAEQLLELCPLAGIRVMVIHPGGIRGWQGPAELECIHALNVAGFRRLAACAARHGVSIAIENMGRIDGRASYGADFGQLQRLVEEVAAPQVGVCLDTSHAHYLQADIPAAIRQLGPRLLATHISDNLGEHDDHLLPYSGRADWPPIVEALRAIGYGGLFNLEIPGENHGAPDILRLKTRYARELLGIMLGEE